jgi:hypothetical protein
VDRGGLALRLWTLHPQYLDAGGLVALWREALLARAVLRGETTGYRHHPQLERFRSCAAPRAAINAYLAQVYREACARRYCFNRAKLGRIASDLQLRATDGQLRYEWSWLLSKLQRRSPLVYRRHRAVRMPEAHPLFEIVRGPVEAWERVQELPGAPSAD